MLHSQRSHQCKTGTMSRLNLYTTKYIYRAEVVELEDEVHEYKPLGDIEVLEKFKCLSPRRSLAN